MITFAALIAGLAVVAITHIRRIHCRCTRCLHRSAIRMTNALLFPTLYCVRCRHEWIPSYDVGLAGAAHASELVQRQWSRRSAHGSVAGHHR